jgi:hypothetical protein
MQSHVDRQSLIGQTREFQKQDQMLRGADRRNSVMP